uniref:SH3 domain-containing protein n=1 Tax=Terrisporobacter sp. TaxID=1965305 RepID=UPI00260A6FC6
EANAQGNTENQNEAPTYNLNERSSKKTGVVTATSLNVRKGASTSHTIIGSLKKGDSVEIVSSDSSGWCKIKYGSGYGYISEQYISITSDSNNDTSSSTTVTHTGNVNASSLNVRDGASSNYNKLGSLARGTTINIVDKMSNGWYKIKFRNGYGYVSGDYITDVKPVNTSGDSNDTSSSTTVTHTGRVKATALNVRNGAGTSYAHIGTLLKGTTVNIVDKMSNGWYKIKFGNGYGYVSASYISDVTPVSGSNDSSDSTVIKTGTVNTNSLNVRSGASTSYSKIGTLSRGAKVEIVNTESNGWYKIKFGNGYGYVSSSYVDIEGERNNLNNFLFIGDSFTVGIQNIIKSKNSNAYVYAKSGSRPSYWLDKVDSMPSSSKIDGVCLLIGVNGASTSANKSDVKTLINKLSAKYPDKTIYVQKVFPVGRAFTGANPASFNKSIASLNSVIESHCETKSNVKFIDTTTGFVDSNGYLIHHNGDGLHIAGSYSNTFYNNILNAIKRAE